MRQHTFESLEPRRLLSFGQPVTSYGTDGGGTIVDFPSSLNKPVELLTDGTARTISITSSLVIRYRTDGNLDSTFATGGKLKLPANLDVYDGAFDREGNLYILANDNSKSPIHGVLYRYTPNGRLDTAWAAGGFTNVTTNETVSGGQITVQRDGKVIVAANMGPRFEERSTTSVFRIDTDGTIDRSFGGRGRVNLVLSPSDPKREVSLDRVLDVAIVSGARIVLVGRGQSATPDREGNGTFVPPDYGPPQFVAVKMNANGSFDRTFGDGSGYLRAAHGTASAGIVMPDGSFAIGGSTIDDRPILSQFEADGSLRFRAISERQTALVSVNDIAVLRDGRLAVSGYDETESYEGNLSLATVTTDGKFTSAVNPRLKTEWPSGSARLATWGSALFVVDTDTRDLDSDDPHEQLMMKIDTRSPNVRPDQFANVGASEMRLARDRSVDLVYYDTQAQRLMYARRDTTGVWLPSEVVDANAHAGDQLSVASSSGGAPWIAYYDGTNGDLKVAHRETADDAWQITTVDSRGNTGRYPNIYTNGGTVPQISYYDASKRDLRFATLERNGTWTTETIDAKGDTGRWSSVTEVFKDRANVTSVAYTDSAGNLNYAERRGNGIWEKDRVMTAKAGSIGGAAYVDIAGAEGMGIISFFDGNNGDLMLAYPDANTWKIRTLASAGVEGMYSRIVQRYPDDNLYILSYNRSADRLTSFTVSPTDLGGRVNRTVVATDYGQFVSGGSEFAYDNQFRASVTLSGFDSKTGKLRVLDGLLN